MLKFFYINCINYLFFSNSYYNSNLGCISSAVFVFFLNDSCLSASLLATGEFNAATRKGYLACLTTTLNTVIFFLFLYISLYFVCFFSRKKNDVLSLANQKNEDCFFFPSFFAPLAFCPFSSSLPDSTMHFRNTKYSYPVVLACLDIDLNDNHTSGKSLHDSGKYFTDMVLATWLPFRPLKR